MELTDVLHSSAPTIQKIRRINPLASGESKRVWTRNIASPPPPTPHCELNPIELAWAAEENYVAGENKDMSLDSVEKLFRKKREELPEDFWRKCVEHVKKTEENYWESDRIQDNNVEQLIIKLKPTDSSSSEMESFSESSDSSDYDQP